MKICLTIVIGFILLNSTTGIAQKIENPASSIKHKVEIFLTEVFLNCPEYIDSFNISSGVEFLDRLIIHNVILGEHPECPLLSNVPLKNKCNDHLTYDFNQFDPTNFNPFKYMFKFYSKEVAYFRVDGTDYIIEIKPIH